MFDFKLVFTSDSSTISEDDYSEFQELSANGIMIIPIDEQTPTPFDAYFTIDKSFVIVEGSVGCCSLGKASSSVPIDLASTMWNFIIEPNDDESLTKIISILCKYNYKLDIVQGT